MLTVMDTQAMSHRLQRAVAACFALFIVAALALAIVAKIQAGHASDATDRTAVRLAAKVIKDQIATTNGRIASCQSSAGIRKLETSGEDLDRASSILWTRIEQIIVPLFEQGATQEIRSIGTEFRAAINEYNRQVEEHNRRVDAFVSTNPNCSTLTAAQRAKALKP